MEDIHNVALETRVSDTQRIIIRQLWDHLYRDRDTKDDLIERDKLLEVFWDRTEAVTEVLDGKET